MQLGERQGGKILDLTGMITTAHGRHIVPMSSGIQLRGDLLSLVGCLAGWQQWAHFLCYLKIFWFHPYRYHLLEIKSLFLNFLIFLFFYYFNFLDFNLLMDHLGNKGKDIFVYDIIRTQRFSGSDSWWQVHDPQLGLATGLCLSFHNCRRVELCTTVSIKRSEDGFLILYWGLFWWLMCLRSEKVSVAKALLV